MKSIKNIKLLMVVGLLLEVGTGLADDPWKPTGPTREDILAATKVENLATKGSLEDKLISAVKKGDLKEVETFIAAGADLEARDNKNMTALMIAAEKGYTDIVKILIKAGVNVTAKDNFNWTAFFRAADKNHPEIVKILIAAGGAENSDSLEELLVKSVHNGNTQMVKALMSAKISYDTLETAYSFAENRRRRNPEIFNIIVEALNKKSQ